MTQKEFKKWVSELPEENDDLPVTFYDHYETHALVEEFYIYKYFEGGFQKQSVNLTGWTNVD